MASEIQSLIGSLAGNVRIDLRGTGAKRSRGIEASPFAAAISTTVANPQGPVVSAVQKSGSGAGTTVPEFSPLQMRTNIEFEREGIDGEIYAKVIDVKTGEVIQRIPREYLNAEVNPGPNPHLDTRI